MTSSANVELVRSIFAEWERGAFFGSAEWAHPDIEFTVADGPEPASWSGLTAMADAFGRFLSAWQDYRYVLEGHRLIDGERVLALTRLEGRGKTSGVQISELRGRRGALVFRFHDGKVTRLIVYWERDRALADLGLAPEGEATGL